MRTMCSREIFRKKHRQQQIFDSDLKGAWHYNHGTFTPIAKKFMLYCRLIYMLSILCVRLTIKVKVGIPESFKVGWEPPQKTRLSHLKTAVKPRRHEKQRLYKIWGVGGGGGRAANKVHMRNVEVVYVFERQTILQTVKM